MKSLKQVPLLKILFFFIAGIIIAEYTGSFIFQYNNIIISSILFFSIIAIVFFRSKNKSILNIFFAMIIILSGVENHFLQDERNKTSHFSKLNISPKSYFTGKIISKKKTASGTSFITEIQSLYSNNKISHISGNLLIYTKFNFDSCNIDNGDIIRFPSAFFPIDKNKNPLAFNPKRYYHFQNVHFLSFPDFKQIEVMERNNSELRNYFSSVRSKIKSNLNELIENDTVKNIAISIILGDKQNLDRNILDSFSATGTRHILTVSGMHVGIIALILNFFFSFLKTENRLVSITRIFLILAGIWYYAFLTGAGAAVLRAAFMISLVMTGLNLRRQVNILNILFGSALILLLINPLQLFQLSFILSYAAMLSILLFYQPINTFLKPANKLLNYFWQLISLSLAAQIIIFPLSLYYFHNAPILFFVSSVVATPMAFGTLFLGFSTILLNVFSQFAAHISGKILEIFIHYCLNFIDYIQSISINIAQYIYLTTIDIFIIASTIFVFLIITKKHSIISKYLILLSFLILTGHQIFRYSINQKNNEIVFYSTNKAIIADIFLSNKRYTYTDGNLNRRKIGYITSNYRNYKGNPKSYSLAETFTTGRLLKHKNIIKADDKTIVFINSENDFLPDNKDKIDFLVIDGNIQIDSKKLLREYKVSKIILSNRTNFQNRILWKKIADEKNIELWDIKEKGAIIEEIKKGKDV